MITGVRALTPVDTGRARDGWVENKVIAKFGDTGNIKNDVPYIGWLEYGTDRTGPTAMVRKTVQKVQQEYKK